MTHLKGMITTLVILSTYPYRIRSTSKDPESSSVQLPRGLKLDHFWVFPPLEVNNHGGFVRVRHRFLTVVAVVVPLPNEPGSKLVVLGMAIPPLIGNPYNGYINPYYWVEFPIPYYMELL